MDYLSKTVRAVQEKLNPDRRLTHNFAGQCGAAQSILYYAFREQDKDFRPLNTQSIPDWFFGHAAGILNENGKAYIIDPTFAQFLQADEVNTIAPADILKRTEEGTNILNALLQY